MGKTDKHHCKTMSFKNYYLTRISGSLNSKKCANNNNGKEDPHQEEVTLVKEWNGITKGKLLRELYMDLVDKCQDKEEEI
jgi:hypothetical protein